MPFICVAPNRVFKLYLPVIIKAGVSVHSIHRKWFWFLLLLLLGCAVQAPPSGGPVDRIPPEIVRTDPLPESTRIAKNLDRLTIVFSERMKEGSERNNLFISPPVPFKVQWKKGHILILQLQEPLKKRQTYVLSIGSALQDAHNNKMTASFNLAFSTGDSIDRGKISGRIYGLKRGQTFYVFAYRLSDSTRFDPFTIQPDYVTLNGQQGNYTLGYLKNGTYRVLAVEDRNHDLLLQAVAERFALSYRDVTLHDSMNVFNGLDMQPARLDTVPPLLTGARAKFNNLLILRFSEPLVLDSLTVITITDSLTNRPLKIKDLAPARKHKKWLEVITAPMDSNRLYRVRCVNLTDSSGNRNRDTLTACFKSTTKTDTTTFKLLHHFPKDSAKTVRPEAAIRLEFNQPLNWRQVRENYRLLNASGKALSGRWQIKNLYQGIFRPQKPLLPDHAYRSVLRLKKIHSYFGKSLQDSLSSHVFQIVSQKELGEISGTVQVQGKVSCPIVVNVQRIAGKRLHLRRVVQGTRAFKFDYLPEGSYKLDVFIDLNANGKFDRGRLLPFRFCEPFKFLPDTIQVRKRWETGGVVVPLPVFADSLR